ncbi:hypothetical protein GCM10009565_41470 [Amycolatopsis albidoflavus]
MTAEAGGLTSKAAEAAAISTPVSLRREQRNIGRSFRPQETGYVRPVQRRADGGTNGVSLLPRDCLRTGDNNTGRTPVRTAH